MVSHYDLAKSFASGATSGKGSRMFIEGNIIYSYGTHFPIAMRLPFNRFLFNTDKYSSSTSKHQSYVMSAINGEVIECNTQEIKNAVGYPEKPVVITKVEKYDCVDDCLENIKQIYKEKGLKQVPIRKIKKLLDDWEMVKSI